MFRPHPLARATFPCLLVAALALPPGYAVAQAPENPDDVEKSAKPANPARIAGQDELLARRLYLDLLGRPPRAEEMRAFLKDASGNRTERLIDRLLKGPEFTERKSALYRLRSIGPLTAVFEDHLTFSVSGAPDANTLLGVSVEPADETTRAQLGLGQNPALVVTEVAADSPAAKAGIEVHDVLVAARGKPLADQGALVQVLKEAEGAEVTLELIRGGERKTLMVQPDPAKSKTEFAEWHVKSTQEMQEVYYVGIQVNALSPALRTQLKLPEDQGVVVTEVLPDTPAARDGLKEHDVLLSLGGEPLREPDDVRERLQKSGGEPAEFKLLRAGKPQTITVAPEKRNEPISAWLDLAAPAQGTFLWSVSPLILDSEIRKSYLAPTEPAASTISRPEEFRQELETLSQHVEALRKLIDSLKQRVPQESEPAEEAEKE